MPVRAGGREKLSRSQIIAEISIMPPEQAEATIRALEAALNLEHDDIQSLIEDGKAILAKRAEMKPPAAKGGRPKGGRKEVIQQNKES